MVRTERQEPLAASRCKEGAVRGRCASREGREEAQGPNRALLQFTASKFTLHFWRVAGPGANQCKNSKSALKELWQSV